MEIELRNVEASSPLIRAFTPNDPSLQEQVVDTQFGSVLVAHQGADHRAAASRPVILTYPDLGLNHITNFQAFFGSPDMQLLLRSFSVLHVNPPGQEEGAATLPDHFQYPTMDQMADQLENVCQHFEVKSVIGFGVGLGANVLSRFALQRPHRVDGLFLINATAGRSSWTEWLYQKWNMYYLGGVPQSLTGIFPQSTQDYLMWHHFGERASDDSRGNRDLLYVYRSLFSGQHLNARNLSLLINSYISRTDLNLDRSQRDDNIQCPTLIVCGHDAPHVDDTIEFNGRMNPEKCTWMKLQDCSLVLEEQPGKVAEALRLFVQGLGYSLSVFHRKLEQRKASSSLSSTSEIPLTDEMDDLSVHIVENPIAEKC